LINSDWVTQVIVTGITGIIIPILVIPINVYFSNKFNNKGLHVQGRNEYRNFLIDNSKPIDNLFYKLDRYKYDTTMKYLFFLEGVPLGLLLFVCLLLLSITLSKINGINKIGFFTVYHNFFYEGQNDIDLLSVVLSFNLFPLIMVVTIAFFFYIFNFKRYTEPKLTEELSLKKCSKYIYYSYWFSIGLIIGLNIGVLLFTISVYDIIIKLITKHLSL